MADAVANLTVGTTSSFRSLWSRGRFPRASGADRHFARVDIISPLDIDEILRAREERPTADVLHYTPIEATVEGEPREIYPYLGCSRLEEPLGRYKVSAVLHGHAHNGALEGRTSTDVPVYNVALPLMRKLTPQHPFRIVDI